MLYLFVFFDRQLFPLLYVSLIVFIQRSRDVLFFFDREMSRVAASLVSDISKLSECLFPFLKNVHTQKVLIHYKQNHKEVPSMPCQMINL